jgi:glycosyltransferase involved in cell wall biosynthesis
VVDDGSKDETAPRATESGAIVLRHARTMGKGAALQTGLTHAIKQGYRWGLMMDGDGQHSPQDIPGFLQCAERAEVSLVVGNRMSQASRIPYIRRWVNRYMSWQISRLVRLELPDSQCGFRLVKLRDWERLSIRTTHFEIESEMLVSFAKAGFVVEFIPIRVIYKAERSKIHAWRDTVRWLRWWRQTRCDIKSG